MVTFLDILFFTHVRASARDTNFGFFSLFFCLQVHDRDGLHDKMGLQLKALKARLLRRWWRPWKMYR